VKSINIRVNRLLPLQNRRILLYLLIKKFFKTSCLRNIFLWFTPLDALFKSVEQNNRFKKCTQGGKPKTNILQGGNLKEIFYKGVKQNSPILQGIKNLLTQQSIIKKNSYKSSIHRMKL
jgi:hypothetical protein